MLTDHIEALRIAVTRTRHTQAFSIDAVVVLPDHVDYIHFNPVKHGLVSRVCDWPYSSFHRYVR